MITAQQVVEIMMDLPDTMMNPIEFETCVYTSPYDENNHCIAGEVISRLGYRLPSIDDALNEDSINALLDSPLYTLSRDDFEEAAVDILWTAQITADNINKETNINNSWGQAKSDAFDAYIDAMLGGE